MPSQHTYRCISNTFVGITLFRQQARSPRTSSADEQKVDTHVFCCVVNLKQKLDLNLGVIGQVSVSMHGAIHDLYRRTPVSLHEF